MIDDKQGDKLQELSKSELLALLSCYDVAALVIRRYVSQKSRDNLRHKVKVYSWISDEKDESLRKYVDVYNISAEINGVWGKFEFTVVEESGNMRIASVWIADGKQ